jgi:hypothetical protein
VSDASEPHDVYKEAFGKGAIWSCLTRIRRLLSRFLLLTGVYLMLECNCAFCREQPSQRLVDSTPTAQDSVASVLTKRPVTVADSVKMTRLGDVKYTEGWPGSKLAAKFSPDGKQFVVILKKGNLDTDTNEYSLVLFQSAELFQAPRPMTLISLASSSNQPAIDNVLWLDDNDTILFLGRRPGEQTQPYSLKCTSKELTKLSSHATNLTSFVATANGRVMAYATRNPAPTFLTELVKRHGIVVTREAVTELIRGNYREGEYTDHSLFIKRLGQDNETRVVLQGQIGNDHPEMSLSPDGHHLLIQTEATHISDRWSEYEDQLLKVKTRNPATRESHTTVYQYELVDTTTGISQVLVDAPIRSLGSEMAWSLDSKSVVVSDIYLPLNIDDPAELESRKAHSFLVEFKIPGREFFKISDEDLTLRSWDPKTGYVVCDIGRINGLTGDTALRAYFRKSGETWSPSSAQEQRAANSLPNVILEEGMNTPPRIVAIDSTTGKRALVMDLNPQFQDLALARVEEITWKDFYGNELKGGLYWPPDYVASKKYPLVIQTHGWTANRFLMDGSFTTAFAAQALAAKGFFVLQENGPDWHVFQTSGEAPSAMASFEGAIDYLDLRGLIDQNRVGITGFSRTDWYVTYTLTHSKHHFAAAALADGVDFSYFQYVAFSNASPELASEFEQVYGGPPYGKTLTQWLQSPAFLMDKIETPLRIQTLGPESVLSDWPWYSGLSRLGKPVEMIYIPEGTHVLEKPWDRMISQQGDVDWFCFWLKGEEDPDPAKVEQYKRWHELRSLHTGETSTVSTGR